MADVTRILPDIEQGDPAAAGQLLPLIYDEPRKLAAQKMGQEKPGRTLQATALVHEAYYRLVDMEIPSLEEQYVETSLHAFFPCERSKYETIAAQLAQ